MSIAEKSERFNAPGIYRDPESGAELEARHHKKFGAAQADAFVRLGWKRIGDAKTATEKIMEAQTAEAQVSSDEFTETATKSGAVQYRKNGKLISKEEYLSSI